MSDRVVVIDRTSANTYHRPREGTDDPMPACRTMKMTSRGLDVCAFWDIERADCWRDQCQRPECYGEPRSSATNPELTEADD